MKIKLALLLLAVFSSAAISCKKLAPTDLKESEYSYPIIVKGTYKNAPVDEQIFIIAEIDKGPTLRTYLSPENQFSFLLPGEKRGLSKVTISTSNGKKTELLNLAPRGESNIDFK